MGLPAASLCFVWTLVLAAASPDRHLQVGLFAPCSATLVPEGPCERDGDGCPFVFNLPPMTVHLPKQLMDLERLVEELQRLKDNVDELREMCKGCAHKECARQGATQDNGGLDVSEETWGSNKNEKWGDNGKTLDEREQVVPAGENVRITDRKKLDGKQRERDDSAKWALDKQNSPLGNSTQLQNRTYGKSERWRDQLTDSKRQTEAADVMEDGRVKPSNGNEEDSGRQKLPGKTLLGDEKKHDARSENRTKNQDDILHHQDRKAKPSDRDSPNRHIWQDKHHKASHGDEAEKKAGSMDESAEQPMDRDRPVWRDKTRVDTNQMGRIVEERGGKASDGRKEGGDAAESSQSGRHVWPDETMETSSTEKIKMSVSGNGSAGTDRRTNGEVRDRSFKGEEMNGESFGDFENRKMIEGTDLLSGGQSLGFIDLDRPVTLTSPPPFTASHMTTDQRGQQEQNNDRGSTKEQLGFDADLARGRDGERSQNGRVKKVEDGHLEKPVLGIQPSYDNIGVPTKTASTVIALDTKSKSNFSSDLKNVRANSRAPLLNVNTNIDGVNDNKPFAKGVKQPSIGAGKMHAMGSVSATSEPHLNTDVIQEERKSSSGPPSQTTQEKDISTRDFELYFNLNAKSSTNKVSGKDSETEVRHEETKPRHIEGLDTIISKTSKAHSNHEETKTGKIDDFDTAISQTSITHSNHDETKPGKIHDLDTTITQTMTHSNHEETKTGNRDGLDSIISHTSITHSNHDEAKTENRDGLDSTISQTSITHSNHDETKTGNRDGLDSIISHTSITHSNHNETKTGNRDGLDSIISHTSITHSNHDETKTGNRDGLDSTISQTSITHSNHNETKIGNRNGLDSTVSQTSKTHSNHNETKTGNKDGLDSTQTSITHSNHDETKTSHIDGLHTTISQTSLDNSKQRGSKTVFERPSQTNNQSIKDNAISNPSLYEAKTKVSDTAHVHTESKDMEASVEPVAQDKTNAFGEDATSTSMPFFTEDNHKHREERPNHNPSKDNSNRKASHSPSLSIDPQISEAFELTTTTRSTTKTSKSTNRYKQIPDKSQTNNDNNPSNPNVNSDKIEGKNIERYVTNSAPEISQIEQENVNTFKGKISQSNRVDPTTDRPEKVQVENNPRAEKEASGLDKIGKFNSALERIEDSATSSTTGPLLNRHSDRRHPGITEIPQYGEQRSNEKEGHKQTDATTSEIIFTPIASNQIPPTTTPAPISNVNDKRSSSRSQPNQRLKKPNAGMKPEANYQKEKNLKNGHKPDRAPSPDTQVNNDRRPTHPKARTKSDQSTQLQVNDKNSPFETQTQNLGPPDQTPTERSITGVRVEETESSNATSIKDSTESRLKQFLQKVGNLQNITRNFTKAQNRSSELSAKEGSKRIPKINIKLPQKNLKLKGHVAKNNPKTDPRQKVNVGAAPKVKNPKINQILSLKNSSKVSPGLKPQTRPGKQKLIPAAKTKQALKAKDKMAKTDVMPTANLTKLAILNTAENVNANPSGQNETSVNSLTMDSNSEATSTESPQTTGPVPSIALTPAPNKATQVSTTPPTKSDLHQSEASWSSPPRVRPLLRSTAPPAGPLAGPKAAAVGKTTPSTARELRVKINQVAAFLNKSSPQRPHERPPGEGPLGEGPGEQKGEGRKADVKAVRDCSDLQLHGHSHSGVYQVRPEPGLGPVSVLCDMEVEGGGWTVLQWRYDGSVSFNRSWAEYRDGFGHLGEGEFWLGNRLLHLLTANRSMELRVELEDFEGVRGHALYKVFRVASERMRFRLTVDGYSGTAGDALRFNARYNHNNRAFTSPDRDNDRYPSGNCGAYYSSGWWFDACMAANLNGRYYKGRYKGVRDGIYWGTWHNISTEYYPTNERLSFKTVRMMIRPKDFRP